MLTREALDCCSSHIRGHCAFAVSQRDCNSGFGVKCFSQYVKMLVWLYFELWEQKKNFCTFSSFNQNGLPISANGENVNLNARVFTK